METRTKVRLAQFFPPRDTSGVGARYGSGEWTVTAGSSRSALAQAPLQSETLVLGVTPDGEQGFLLRNDTQVSERTRVA